MSRYFFHSRRRALALVATAAAVVAIGAGVSTAYAAVTTPSVTVTIVQQNVAAVVGKNFTPNAAATVSASAGTYAGKATTAVRPDGRFAATIFLPANYKGIVKATARAGTQTASGTAIAGSTAPAPKAAPIPKPLPKPATGTVSQASSGTAKTGAATAPPTGAHKLGVGGVKAPAGAIVTKADSKSELKITESGSTGKPKVYDGGGHTVGTITIEGDWITVQNFKINATGQYGIESKGHHITIQNNDIKGVHASGDGDLNAITFSGDYHTIAYNTAVDFVTGDPGGSHTDAIQTWVSDSHLSSSYVVIQGNKFSGPDKSAGAPIHQCVMAEGQGRGGNSGGSGESAHWLIADNYFKDSWNQCIKLDGINDVQITRNQFAGNSSNVFEDDGTGNKFFSDNKITGSYGSKPNITNGAGPTKLSVASAYKKTK